MTCHILFGQVSSLANADCNKMVSLQGVLESIPIITLVTLKG